MYSTISQAPPAAGNYTPPSNYPQSTASASPALPVPNGQLATALGDLDGRMQTLEQTLSGLANQLGPVLIPSVPTPCCESPAQPAAEILRIVDQISNRIATQTDIVRELSRRLVV